MFDIPKLAVVILVIAAVWYGLRWLNAPSSQPRRRAPPRRPPAAATTDAEDLVACGVCGAYVAVSAPSCGKPGCPRPR